MTDEVMELVERWRGRVGNFDGSERLSDARGKGCHDNWRPERKGEGWAADMFKCRQRRLVLVVWAFVFV